MRTFVAAVAALLFLSFMSPALADSGEVSLVSQSRECWDHGSTLYHFTVFNSTRVRQRVTYEFQYSDSDTSTIKKFWVRKSQGVQAAIKIRPTQTIEWIKAETEDGLFMYRLAPVHPKHC